MKRVAAPDVVFYVMFCRDIDAYVAERIKAYHLDSADLFILWVIIVEIRRMEIEKQLKGATIERAAQTYQNIQAIQKLVRDTVVFE